MHPILVSYLIGTNLAISLRIVFDKSFEKFNLPIFLHILSFRIAMSSFSFTNKFAVLSTEPLSDETLVKERGSSAR